MPRPHIEWLALPAALAAAPCAFGVEYLSLSQAQSTLFADAAQFAPLDVVLTGAQADAVKKASGAPVRDPKMHVWRALSRTNDLLGFVIVDAVYGKHEFINYAVAVGPEGAVRGVEIMTYNETYGGEIRSPAWRAQFGGKKAGDELKINKDIRNIGGATLSCAHVTEGIRRILAAFEVAIKAPA